MVGGTAIGPWHSCSMGSGILGLQLLATTVSSSSPSLFSSERIWKELLLHVTCLCTMGNWWMVFRDVIMFNVVATLGGTATTALGGVAVSTLGAVGMGGGALGCLDMIKEGCWMADRCFIFANGHSRDCATNLFKDVTGRVQSFVMLG
jgi:hypothetical protein